MIKIVSLRELTFLRLLTAGTIVTLLMLFMSASQLQAQASWSLQDCINYAFDNNLDIKKQVLVVETNKANVLQTKLNTLPSINAGASTVNNWGRTIDQYTNTFATNRVRSDNMYVQGNITLFNGLQKINLIKKNQLTLKYSKFSLDDLLDNISLTVAGYYLDILFNKELLLVAREQLGVTEQQVSRMKKLVEAGTLARGDLLNIQAQSAREELQVVESENRLEISYLSLMQLIDYPVNEDFDVQIPRLRSVEAPSIDITSDQIYSYALLNRPEVRLAELNVDIAQKDIALARGQQSPVISLGGSWGSGYSGLNEIYNDPVYVDREFGWTESGEPVYTSTIDRYNDIQVKDWADQLNDNNNRSIGFYLNIPIFNGWQVRNSITRAKIAQESAEHDLQMTKNNLRKVIQQAYADAVAALKKYGSSLKQVEAQSEAFKYAEQKFDVGLINSVEYNEIKKELTLAQSDLLQAKYDYIFKTTILSFYMGNPLSIE
ncbi:MAG: TolC family protein [Bacteroidales bacterium]|nr:TolC family protein [Bacteroidales bacterium]